MTLGILVIFVGLLIWGIKSRQFHNVEEPKYRMMEDDGVAKTKREPAKRKKS